ncbi:uncharacterized protein METZ01_LOCUS201411, partial [marine metagenome]
VEATSGIDTDVASVAPNRILQGDRSAQHNSRSALFETLTLGGNLPNLDQAATIVLSLDYVNLAE